MKEVTLKIPNKKLEFFMELVKQLGFEISESIEIPEKHKSIVRERIKKSKDNPEEILSWDEVKDSFRYNQ